MTAPAKKNEKNVKKSFWSELKSLLQATFSNFFSNPTADLPPYIGEDTKIATLLQHYPEFEFFLYSHHRIALTAQSRVLSFGSLCQTHSLPTARVVFMEFQLFLRSPARAMDGRTFAKFIQESEVILLDARESWELEVAKLPGSTPLTANQLEKLLEGTDKNRPVAIYCHYGIRSLDAAAYLTDRGFKNVATLRGGLEAWNQQVDPEFPRYCGHPC